MINIYEAVYQANNGKTVLIIDQGKTIGGAWKTLDIFGLHDIENAIHYFLTDHKGIDFMSKNLGWNIVRSERKYRVIEIHNGFFLKLPFESKLARSFVKLVGVFSKDSTNKIAGILSSLVLLIKRSTNESFYVRGGSAEMLDKTKTILNNSNVKLKLNTKITEVSVNTRKKTVFLNTDFGLVQCSVLYLSHGARLEKILFDNISKKINEKIHPRPCVHLLVNDSSPSPVYEAVFTSDNLIKYAHNVSRFSREADSIKDKLKIFVLAINHDILNFEGLGQELLEKLISAGMAGKLATLKDFKWTDIILPTLDDQDLYNLKANSAGSIEILRTENFCRGVGYYANRWRKSVKLNLEYKLYCD